MTPLRILSAGPGVTLQDGGRRGLLRFGVTGAGPMDSFAFAIANAAAGAPRNATTIEVSLGGIELAADEPVSLAIAGGAFRIDLGGRPLPSAVVVTPEPGQPIRIAPGGSGAWCYVAVAGRFDVPPVLGSTATHVRSGLGGLSGRALQTGDVLPVANPRVITVAGACIIPPGLEPAGDAIRVVLGPQDDYFDERAIAAFLQGPWTVSPRSDRMAYQLEGPRIHHAKGFNILSDAIAFGAVQVPGEGKPVVLMADRQPTGGYPKIANVIGADLGRMAQLRPGAKLRFTSVSIAEAVAARRARAAALAAKVALEPIVRRNFSSEFLLQVNLVGGVTADGEPDGETPDVKFSGALPGD
jgi:5-oxoprolinase (ATP-hydrolysing) subunit C